MENNKIELNKSPSLSGPDDQIPIYNLLTYNEVFSI